MPISAGDNWVLNLAANTAKDPELLTELLRRIGQANPNPRVMPALETTIEHITHEKRNRRRQQHMDELRAAGITAGSELEYHANGSSSVVRVVRYHPTEPKLRIAVLDQSRNILHHAWVMVDHLDLLIQQDEQILPTGQK